MIDCLLTAVFIFYIYLDIILTMTVISFYIVLSRMLEYKELDRAFQSVLQICGYYLFVLDTKHFFGEVAAYTLTVIILLSYKENTTLNINHVRNTTEAMKFIVHGFIITLLVYYTKLKLNVVIV